MLNRQHRDSIGVLALVILLTMIFLIGCGQSDEVEQPDEIVYGLTLLPSGIDPHIRAGTVPEDLNPLHGDIHDVRLADQRPHAVLHPQHGVPVRCVTEVADAEQVRPLLEGREFARQPVQQQAAFGQQLDVLATVAPDHPHIPVLMKRLGDRAKGGRWHNTQENFFVLLAVFPFSRLIHIATYPIGYLIRPWQIVISYLAPQRGPADFQKLNIKKGDRFTVQFGDKKARVLLGTTFGDVPKGEWIAFFKEDGLLKIARNFDIAVKILGCKEGDMVFITR